MDKSLLDDLSQPIVDIYNGLEHDMLINIAGKIKDKKALLDIDPVAWELQMMQNLGMLDKDNLKMLAKHSGLTAGGINGILLTAGIDGLESNEEIIAKATKKGAHLMVPPPVTESPTILKILGAYQNQAKNTLNLTNQTMLLQAKKVYTDIISRTTADVLSGTMTGEKALRKTIKQWAENGVPALIDSAGRRWSPEGYVRTVIRSTVGNTVNTMQDARFDEYGVELVEISSHAGARPKCAPYQGRVFSLKAGHEKYPPISSTSQGMIDGLFGINCGHSKYPFFEGISVQRFTPYEDKENARVYKESQHQRALERSIRKAKTQQGMLKAAGDDEGAKQIDKLIAIRQLKMRKFIKDTGRTRRSAREQIVGLDKVIPIKQVKVPMVKPVKAVVPKVAKPVTPDEPLFGGFTKKQIAESNKTNIEIIEKALAEDKMMTPHKIKAQILLKNYKEKGTYDEINTKVTYNPATGITKEDLSEVLVKQNVDIEYLGKLDDVDKAKFDTIVSDLQSKVKLKNGLEKDIKFVLVESKDIVPNAFDIGMDFKKLAVYDKKSNKMYVSADHLKLPDKKLTFKEIKEASANGKTLNNTFGDPFSGFDYDSVMTREMGKKLFDENKDDLMETIAKDFEGTGMLRDWTKKNISQGSSGNVDESVLEMWSVFNKADYENGFLPPNIEKLFDSLMDVSKIPDVPAIKVKLVKHSAVDIKSQNKKNKESIGELYLNGKGYTDEQQARFKELYFKIRQGEYSDKFMEIAFDKDGLMILVEKEFLEVAEDAIDKVHKIVIPKPKLNKDGSLDVSAYKYVNKGNADVHRDAVELDKVFYEAKDHIIDYTGGAYTDYNEYMRKGSMGSPQKSAMWKHKTEVLKSQLEQFSKPLTENTILTRRMGAKAADFIFDKETKALFKDLVNGEGVKEQVLEQMNKRLSGAKLKDEAFVSTSFKDDVFIKREGIEIQIMAPKGFNNGAYVNSISQHAGEGEYLVNAGQQFKIMDVRYGNEALLDGTKHTRLILVVVPI